MTAAPATEEIVLPYEPRDLQAQIHAGLDSHRFALLVCHRRFGKTVAAILQLIVGALECTRQRPRFAYMAPLYKQAKDVAWDYLVHFTKDIPGRQVRQADLRVDFPNGARIQLYGADNPDALRGIYLDGAVLDEYGQMHGRAWGEVIRPALSDRKGWALFLGTPQGKNQFWDLHQQVKDLPEWFVRTYRASETGIIDPDELVMLRRQMDPDEYAQEYECSWSAAVKGAYYAKLLDRARDEGRIGKVPIEADLPAETWWDLGIGDATAIWIVQPHRQEIRVVDYIEGTGQGLAYYAKHLKEWANQWGVGWDHHRAPHDIEVRELGTGITRKETAARLGLRMVTAPKMPIWDGIEAVRNLLSACWFDEERCGRGLDALWHYRSDYNQRTGELTQPIHDWASHGADAFRTGAVSRGRQRVKGTTVRMRRGPSAMTI